MTCHGVKGYSKQFLKKSLARKLKFPFMLAGLLNNSQVFFNIVMKANQLQNKHWCTKIFIIKLA